MKTHHKGPDMFPATPPAGRAANCSRAEAMTIAKIDRVGQRTGRAVGQLKRG